MRIELSGQITIKQADKLQRILNEFFNTDFNTILEHDKVVFIDGF